MRVSSMKKAVLCKYCKLPLGQVHIIGTHPEDEFAHLEDQKCGSCVQKEYEDIILAESPNSIRAQEVIVERQRRLEAKLRTDVEIRALTYKNYHPNWLIYFRNFPVFGQ